MAGEKILVVDDELGIAQSIRLLLSMEGYKVDTAHDGVEALECVDKCRPQLIVLDVMMPRKNGWEVLEELRGRPDTHDIPVILLTALDDVENMEKGAVLDSDCYMTKPFEPDELSLMVARLLKTQKDQTLPHADRD